MAVEIQIQFENVGTDRERAQIHFRDLERKVQHVLPCRLQSFDQSASNIRALVVDVDQLDLSPISNVILIEKEEF